MKEYKLYINGAMERMLQMEKDLILLDPATEEEWA